MQIYFQSTSQNTWRKWRQSWNGARCWLGQRRRALTESSCFKACFNSSACTAQSDCLSHVGWHSSCDTPGSGYQLLHTLQLFASALVLCVFTLSSQRSCHLSSMWGSGVGINHSKTPSAACPVRSAGTECWVTVLSRQDAIWLSQCFVSAAGPEQLCSLLHLRCWPEGPLPEYCADHPGEYSSYHLKPDCLHYALILTPTLF